MAHKILIGVIGLPPLPYRFNSTLSLGEITARAVEEARILCAGGVDSAIIQNLHDLPPTPDSSTEVAAYMTAVTCEVRRQVPDLGLGVNVLQDDYRAALAVAAAADCAYVRLKSYVGASMASNGYSGGCCSQAIDYRHRIGADHIRIYADVMERMSRALGKEDPAFQASQAVGFGKADGAVITGDSIEQAVSFGTLARKSVPTGKALWLGGGATLENMAQWADVFDGVIVGLGFRQAGYSSPYCAEKVRAFRQALDTVSP